MKKKKMTYYQKVDLAAQARESRQQYWDEHAPGLEEKAAKLQAKLDSLYTDDLAEFERISKTPEYKALQEEARAAQQAWGEFWNNNHPSAAEMKAQERKQMKRKSKKNVSSRIEIIDRSALYDVEAKETTIEWGDTFQEGNLVMTRDGDIGMVMEQWDPTHNRVSRPKHIKAAIAGAYVRLLVNGREEWHTKVSVSSPEDN